MIYFLAFIDIAILLIFLEVGTFCLFLKKVNEKG